MKLAPVIPCSNPGCDHAINPHGTVHYGLYSQRPYCSPVCFAAAESSTCSPDEITTVSRPRMSPPRGCGEAARRPTPMDATPPASASGGGAVQLRRSVALIGEAKEAAPTRHWDWLPIAELCEGCPAIESASQARDLLDDLKSEPSQWERWRMLADHGMAKTTITGWLTKRGLWVQP